MPLTNASPAKPGQVLLHAGMHTAGTGLIEHAASSLRSELLRHNVVYPGTSLNHARAARAVGALTAEPDATASTTNSANTRPWNRLVSVLNSSADTIGFIGDERFARLPVDICQKIVTDMGKPVTVTITLQNLITLPVWLWQQGLKSGVTAELEPWLRENISEDFAISADSVRAQILVADVVEKWASVVGPENVVLIVHDEHAPDAVTRPFESLLGLPEGLLATASGPSLHIRSMTPDEAELLRDINRAMETLPIAGGADYLRLYRDSAITPMLASPSVTAEPLSLSTPTWVVDILKPIAHDQIKTIKACGVKIIGDIDTIAATPSDAHTNAASGNIPIESASKFVADVVKAAATTIDQLDEEIRVARAERDASLRRWNADRVLDSWSAGQVLKVGTTEFARRILRRVKRFVKRA